VGFAENFRVSEEFIESLNVSENIAKIADI
jgi:hypothetical protein